MDSPSKIIRGSRGKITTVLIPNLSNSLNGYQCVNRHLGPRLGSSKLETYDRYLVLENVGDKEKGENLGRSLHVYSETEFRRRMISYDSEEERSKELYCFL